jgi:hypothetical protein
MNEIDHFKIFVFYSNDIRTEIDHFHVREFT